MDRLHGYHLMIQGYGDDVSGWDVPLVAQFLTEGVRAADMLLIARTVERREHQVYGIAVLAESHLSVHLDCDQGAAWIDLFSCREFNVTTILGLVVTTFGLVEWFDQSVRRDAPRPPVRA